MALCGEEADAVMAPPQEAGDEIIDVDELQTMGINACDIKKLKEAGIIVASALMMYPMKHLTTIKGLTEAKILKMKDAAVKLCPQLGFMTGRQCLEQHEKFRFRVGTGAAAVDQLLRGGFESTTITEIIGEYRTGKTMMAHTAAVVAQLPRSMGGGEGKCLYLDTEGGFVPAKIQRIAQRYGLDPAEVLDNITYARIYNSDMQCDIVDALAAKLAEEKYALIICDSATALFRVDYSGRGELSIRQQNLNKFLAALRKLASQFNVAVVITNQVMSDPGGGAMFVTDPKKPVGGHIIAHASSMRLLLRKGRGESRICKVIDAPDIAEGEATFDLTESGVADSSE